MPSLLVTAVAGVCFGLALAAPPGPMNAVIAEESALRGYLPGFTAGLGAMSADLCFCLLSLAGVVTVVRRLPTLRGVMVAVGGLLMLYFAYGAATDALEQSAFGSDGEVPETPPADGPGDGTAPPSGRPDSLDTQGFKKAFLLAITNPYQIVFWLTIGVGLLDPGRLDVFSHVPYTDALAGTLVVRTGHPLLLVGLFGGVLLWITGFPAALVAVGRSTDRFAPLVAGVSAVVLAGFGLLFLVDGASILSSVGPLSV